MRHNRKFVLDDDGIDSSDYSFQNFFEDNKIKAEVLNSTEKGKSKGKISRNIEKLALDTFINPKTEEM